FAVLEPYQTLAVMAVDRFVYATVDTSHIPLLSLDNFELYDITWTYANKKVTVHSKDKRVRFVENALTIVCIYLQEQAIPIRSVHISIRSELDDASGKKIRSRIECCCCDSSCSCYVNSTLQGKT